jgi:hypothetical protein
MFAAGKLLQTHQSPPYPPESVVYQVRPDQLLHQDIFVTLLQG